MKRAKKVTVALDDPFMIVRTGTPRQMQAYIEDRGINPNKCRTSSGWSLLHRAAELGQTEICEVLIHFGAKINEKTSQGWYSPLHLAVGNGWYETACYLLDVGADVSLKNKYNQDVFAFATKKGFEDVSKRVYLAAKIKARDKQLKRLTASRGDTASKGGSGLFGNDDSFDESANEEDTDED